MTLITFGVSSCGPSSSPIPTPLPPTQTPPPTQPVGASYYVDSANGQDSNSGLSPSQAWQPVLDRFYHPLNYPHDHNLFYSPGDSAISDPVGYPPGPGDIIADPQFVDFNARDLHLQPSSPAVNMGTDLGYTSDYDGNPVPIGPAPDAGAYEYQSYDA